MAYIVKDTFEYTGEETFNTLEEFLQWFWQGSFEDFITLVSTKTDVEDGVAKVRLLQTNIINQSWDPDTNTYTRIVDFESAVNYLTNRMAIQGLPYLNDVDPYLQQIVDASTEYIKTTEIIG